MWIKSIYLPNIFLKIKYKSKPVRLRNLLQTSLQRNFCLTSPKFFAIFSSKLIKDINEISAWVTWADMELRSYLPRVPFLPAGPTGPLGKKGTLGSNMIKTWMIKVGLPVLLLWVFSNVDPNLYQFFGNKLFLKIVKTLSRLFLFFFFFFHNFVGLSGCIILRHALDYNI